MTSQNPFELAKEPNEETIKGLELFQKQLLNLKRFSGTENDATFLIRRKLNDPEAEKIAFVSTKRELYDNYQDTWEKARKLPLSAVQFLEAFTFTYLYLYIDGFRLQFRDGKRFEAPDVESLVGNDAARCRTISNYLQTDETGLKPKRITRKVDLLQTIELMARTYDAVCAFAKKQI